MSQLENNQELKEFEIYHIENYGDSGGDRYYNGAINAVSMDKAIEIFKNEWIKPEFKDDITEDYQDQGLCYLETGLEWFKNGDLLNDEQIEELESKYEMDISDMLDNFDDKLDFDISCVEHIYELRDNDFDPSNDDNGEEDDQE